MTDGQLTNPDECDHDWQPAAFTPFWGEMPVSVPLPIAPEAAKVYLVCLACAQHTCIRTTLREET